MAQKKNLSAFTLNAAPAVRSAGRKSSPDFKAASPVRLRAGDLCPKCKLERLDYDGLLNLSCPQCGAVDGAWGGCS